MTNNGEKGEPMSLYYRRTAEGIVDFLVYTEDLKAYKHVKAPPSMYFRKGKLFAHHWVCSENDRTYTELWKWLGLTEENEKREKRTRRTKAEMAAAREGNDDE
jgi:hypothetical protein